MALLRRVSAAITGGTVVYAGLLAVSACGDDSPETGQERVTIDTRIEMVEGGSSFENAFGFQIELEQALLSVGALYFHEGAPLARTPPAWLGIGTAWAHPGHYVEGETLGEMLTPQSVDLLAGATDLAAGDGVTGAVLSGSFSFFSPPTGALADVLDGHVALVEGTATRDSLTLSFRATADEADVMNTQGEPVIIGCSFDGGAITGDGTVAVTVDTTLWLDQVDFDLVEPSPDGSRVDLPRGDPPHNAFVRGLEKAASYTFSFSPRSN